MELDPISAVSVGEKVRYRGNELVAYAWAAPELTYQHFINHTDRQDNPVPKLWFFRGLPGSGKSTLADIIVEKLLSRNYAIINKDELRLAFPQALEMAIVEIERGSVEALMKYRKFLDGPGAWNILLTNTHLNPVHEEFYRNLAEQYGFDFVVVDLCSVCPAECIRRNNLRKVGVIPDEAIVKMFNKNLDYFRPWIIKKYKDFFQKILMSPIDLMEAHFLDLDGTIALHNDRNPYDWSKCNTDLVNGPLHKLLIDSTTPIVCISGRSSDAYDLTDKWLSEKTDICERALYMRGPKDNRKDWLVKLELAADVITNHGYWPEIIFDDRDSVVKTWRDVGFTCFQVAPGNF